MFTKLIDSLLEELRGLGNTKHYLITFKHILYALNYLNQNSIIYQDIKPANILYKITIDSYYFQLGDFGLYNRAANIKTFCGI